MVDNVNHPPHYTTGSIEVIDFILDQQFGYLDGQVIKYLCRHAHKGTQLEDLKKAQWYLNKLITLLENKYDNTNIPSPTTTGKETYKEPDSPDYWTVPGGDDATRDGG